MHIKSHHNSLDVKPANTVVEVKRKTIVFGILINEKRKLKCFISLNFPKYKMWYDNCTP